MELIRLISTVLCGIVITRCEPVGRHVQLGSSPETRRILNGKEVGETRPYMVYLRPAAQADKQFVDNKWLCGGVIIHSRYILTSAACIEDVKNFYVISGTSVWTPPKEENACITNGAKKAIWKCVPKNYYFDGAEFDNIRWMSGDVAVVKVNEDFNFHKRVLGCDYIPKIINFNNVSADFEQPKTMGSIAGWGSINIYGDPITLRTSENSVQLLETDVQIITKKSCKNRWEPRYHNIIDESMVCSKDDQDGSLMSKACREGGVDCKELEYSMEDEDGDKQFRIKNRRVLDPSGLEVHGAWHQQPNMTRRFKVESGGFCENDHGGPLVVGHGSTSMVVGIMSACLTKDISKKCYGPYLYTSIYTYRHLISCAIDKDIGNSETCRREFGDSKTNKNQFSETTFDWLISHHVQIMVGYDKDDVLTTNQKLIVGCLSGVITRFVTQPMDVIKLRTQLQKTRPGRPKNIQLLKVTRMIYKEEGITAFWHGHNLGQIYSVLGVSSQFFVYEMATRYVAGTNLSKDHKHVMVFLSGIFAGCASATVVLPLEVIRVRQMLVKDQYKGFLKGAKGVYKSGGIFAFYEGLTASLLQMGPQVGISFCVFRFVQPLILKYFQKCEEGPGGHACRSAPSNVHQPEYLLIATTLAGSAAGFISKTITYPLDLAKRRMQIGSHKEDARYKPPSTSKHLIKCKALMECLLKTVKYEGFWGLYRGWKVTVIKAQMTSVVAFTSYELFCYVIRESMLKKK